MNTTIHSESEKLPEYRNTKQFLMPAQIEKEESEKKGFEIFPYSSLGPGKISSDWKGLAQWVMKQKHVCIDGYVGVFWDDFIKELSGFLPGKTCWIATRDFFKSEEVLAEMLHPDLGEETSIWGKRSKAKLEDYFESTDFLNAIQVQEFDQVVIFGVGAGLCTERCPVAYIDLPKNELQYRMKAGKAHNLGFSTIKEPYLMYKHYYFIDWKVLDRYKKGLMDTIEVFIDGQRKDTCTWAYSQAIYEGLDELLQRPIRVRPWFEPGAWGGQWMKDKISGLNKAVVNYAWAFSFIVPENGILFESDGFLLELSFDFLMFKNGKKVLGSHVERFGDEFPIRFNFLDTINGGNLSMQCHPSTEYIKKEFGENFTQDETYYILDNHEDAGVYLGFQENIDKQSFREVLEKSQKFGEKIPIEEFVQTFPSEKHDLFLIPNGTVHSSGSGNMVLEISATPYIFTFKMYDWMRLDLDGKPRPINIDRAFDNLNFNRKGDLVEKELVSKPYTRKSTSDYQLIHYPTHPQHFYDIERIDFDQKASFDSDGNFYLMMIVEGEAIRIETAGEEIMLSYGETFLIPAAMGSYTMHNRGKDPVKVIRAFIKHPHEKVSDSRVN